MSQTKSKRTRAGSEPVISLSPFGKKQGENDPGIIRRKRRDTAISDSDASLDKNSSDARVGTHIRSEDHTGPSEDSSSHLTKLGLSEGPHSEGLYLMVDVTPPPPQESVPSTPSSFPGILEYQQRNDEDSDVPTVRERERRFFSYFRNPENNNFYFNNLLISFIIFIFDLIYQMLTPTKNNNEKTLSIMILLGIILISNLIVFILSLFKINIIVIFIMMLIIPAIIYFIVVLVLKNNGIVEKIDYYDIFIFAGEIVLKIILNLIIYGRN